MATELSSVLGHIETISRAGGRPRRADQPRRRGRQRAARRCPRRRACRATSRSPQAPAVQDDEFLVRARRHDRRHDAHRQAGRRRRGGRATSMPRALRGLPRQGRGRRAQRLHLGGRRRAGGQRRAQPRWGGVPLAVKDLFCTEGVPSQSGSRILEGYLPPYSASVVERLTAAGAPLLAKTNQDEFAMGSSNENSGYGPVLKPVGRTRVPGGSPAAAPPPSPPARAPWALGTDTGGSVRQPAALTRHRRPQAHVRQRLALRDDRLRLFAGPGRAADA